MTIGTAVWLCYQIVWIQQLLKYCVTCKLDLSPFDINFTVWHTQFQPQMEQTYYTTAPGRIHTIRPSIRRVRANVVVGSDRKVSRMKRDKIIAKEISTG